MTKMTEEQKEARKLAREAKKAAEELEAQEKFLADREKFYREVPFAALRLLARAERLKLPVYLHTKITEGTQAFGDDPPLNYLLVQLWTGDQDLDIDLYVWDGVAPTPTILSNLMWEFDVAMGDFERYEEKVLGEELKTKKRRELLERLTAEERELLGV